jgi:divinyl chlorophyllide a 8-vinyl-reductase
MLLGGTGTIGRATVRALVSRGHEVVCLLRPSLQESARGAELQKFLQGATIRRGHPTDAASLAADGFRGERFDVLLSCLASRNGAPKDAWAVDYQAHVNALTAARDAGVSQFVLLSAICVQRPLLAFQKAKLAFERLLMDSNLPYSIVRPTAFFKSLSGQVDRVRRGKPFLIFGDGTRTACKPISDHDLAEYLADCLDDASRLNAVLPIGGPGPAITPRQQGECLFRLFSREPQFRSVPLALLDGIIGTLTAAGHLIPALAGKAELARIGRYYASESMLVFDSNSGRYDEKLTPSTGTETLFDYYATLAQGAALPDRGDHAVY